MCGTGDMLSACAPTEYPNKVYTGVEIDNGVFKHAVQRFYSNKNVKLIRGNVFQLGNLKKIASVAYDLVITNPPYVRYQTLSDNKANTPGYLNVSEIKSNLIASLPSFKQLDKEDRDLFNNLISNYSGLSDLAVPSWILCALLTKVSGRIAMVVPQTWLNRDYAGVIHYLLLRWFQIECVIEDANSVWFPNAQVKTTLVVAKRINRKDSIYTWKNEAFTYCPIYSTARNGTSLIGKMFPGESDPEKLFTEIIHNSSQPSDFLTKSRIRLADFAKDLAVKAGKSKWFNAVELNKPKLSSGGGNSVKVPSQLRDWLENREFQFQSLADIGVNVSQGLRTGANVFFYMDIVERVSDGILALPGKPFDQKPIPIPSGFYREVIRKQSELKDTYSTYDLASKGIVLSLQNGICPEDLAFWEQAKIPAQNLYKVVPQELSNHILKGAQVNIGTKQKPRYIPLLSAVAPNAKSWNPTKPQELPRYWYMLPKFTKRHFPDLFIPRVNGTYPITRMNMDGTYLIDANFSTLWISDSKSAYNNYALLALLNSSWCVAAMEEYGTVMGGGALKLEATQLKKIPIPILKSDAITELSILGEQLTRRKDTHSQTIEKIDWIILEALGMKENFSEKLKHLVSLKTRLFKQRSGK